MAAKKPTTAPANDATATETAGIQRAVKSVYKVGDQEFDKKADARAYLALMNLDAALAALPLEQVRDEGHLAVRNWMLKTGWPLVNTLSDVLRRSSESKHDANAIEQDSE